MSKHLINEKLKIKAKALNYKDGEEVTVNISLLDNNHKCLALYESKIKVNNESANFEFTVQSIAETLNEYTNEYRDKISYFKSCICDGEVDCDAEIISKVIGDVDVIILVSGTTDPINTDKKIYNKEDSNVSCKCINDDLGSYWNNNFINSISQLESNVDSVKVVDFQQWSGDNCITARKNAAIYLVNKLCGDKGEKAIFTKCYQDRVVNFHFIGHSHGGNVINEVTEAINGSSLWSNKWKIKTITYLSTPFFEKLHQPCIEDKVFYRDAQILHLYNEYDLTQRVITNFSMHQLAGIADKTDKTDTVNFDNLIKSLNELNFNEISKALLNDKKKESISANGYLDFAFKLTRVGLLVPSILLAIFNYVYEKYDEGRYKTKEDAKKIYEEIAKFLSKKDIEDKTIVGGLAKVLVEFLEVARQLNQPIKFAVQDTTSHKREIKRKVICDVAFKKIAKIINTFQSDIKDLVDKLNEKQEEDDVQEANENKFDIIWLVEDILSSKLVKDLVDFINIKEDHLDNENSLWYIIALLLEHNIEQYDNTYVDPTKLYANSFLKDNIKGVNITKRNYKSNDYKVNYDKFINKLNEIEQKVYEGKQANKSELLNMLFTLMANDKLLDNTFTILFFAPFASWLLKVATNNETDKSIKHINSVLKNIKVVLDNRKVKSSADQYEIDDINSLAYDSHNLSKYYLHIEVIDFLYKNTYKNRSEYEET